MSFLDTLSAPELSYSTKGVESTLILLLLLSYVRAEHHQFSRVSNNEKKMPLRTVLMPWCYYGFQWMLMDFLLVAHYTYCLGIWNYIKALFIIYLLYLDNWGKVRKWETLVLHLGIKFQEKRFHKHMSHDIWPFCSSLSCYSFVDISHKEWCFWMCTIMILTEDNVIFMSFLSISFEFLRLISKFPHHDQVCVN